MNMLKTLAVAMVVAVSLAGVAHAKDDLSPADKAAMHSYVLSMDKIKGLNDAMKDFNALEKSDPSFNIKSAGDTSKSFGEMETKFNANPKAMAVLRKHGLTAHDLVFMPFVLMYAGMIAEYPSAGAKLSDETSPAQIGFYKAHKADLEKLDFLSGK